MKIGIFGLGYVGVVNTVCFAELGHQVIGCDIKSQKVTSLLSGKSPVWEPLVDDILQKQLANGNIKATTNAKEVLEHADIILICVGTPSMPDGTVNLDYTINTTIEIAQILNETNKSLTIAYRSTIPPHSVEGTFRPLFEKYLKNYSGKLKLAFYPEFLREGSAVKDFMEAPRIVIGTKENDISELKALLSYNENSPVVITDTHTAEFVKYVDNCYHAIKVAFANEVYSIGKGFNIDIELANNIFLMDKHLNISTRYLRPGLPFGGSCLPKDLRAMRYFSRLNNIDAPLMNSLTESNEKFQHRILEMVLKHQKSKILLVGITFKNYTDDVRESPMLRLANDIISNAKNELMVFDEDINLVSLRIENSNIVKYIETDLSKAMAAAELVIVTKRYMPEVLKFAKADQIIMNFADMKRYDTVAKMEYLY
jgi:GDP-mannose 6-dehydrogenase